MGQYLGNYAPYGYEKSPFDRHVLVPCTPKAKVVTAIFRLYLMGFSCAGVAEVLEVCGSIVPCRSLGAGGERLRQEGERHLDGIYHMQNFEKSCIFGKYGAGENRKNQL